MTKQKSTPDTDPGTVKTFIPTRCEHTVVSGYHVNQCANKAIGAESNGDAYCGVHAPRSKRRETAVQRRQREAIETDISRQAEAIAILDMLGVDGCAEYRYVNSQSPRFRRSIIITFDEAIKLVQRLQSSDKAVTR